MRKKKLASLILLVFVLLCNCDYFKSLCEPENAPKKQPTTLQNIVNNATDGEIINLEEWENVTDYTATINKKLTIKSGNLNGASLTVKAENVKLEKMQNLSVETSSRLTIKDSKLNNLLLDGNAQSRSNTTAEINVILENCEIAEKIKINSQAKLNITGKKTKIAKIVVAVVETLCKIFCAEELDTTEIKDIIVDEDNKKLENVKVSKAYKIIYHSNCEGIADFEDFFSPDDGTISLPTDIFKRDGYIFTGWYYDNNQAVEDSINVSDKTENIDVYAGWTKYIPGSGVYKYSINIEDIPESGPWNGSRTSPAFSILLLTEKLIDASIKHGDFYFSNDAYQIQTRASENLRITDTSKTGNYAVYGEVPTNIDSIPENDKYKYYSGVAATVTDTTLEIFVDMSKIVKTELKVFRKSESSTAQEEFVTENTLIDLTDYKPYIIALGTKDTAPDNSYLFTAWEADLMSMKEGATFPTDLQQSPPTTGNTNSVTVTNISVNSTNHKTSYYIGEEFDLTELTIKVEKSDGTTETISVTSEMITGFDSSTAGTKTLTITYGGCTTTFNIEVKELTATADDVGTVIAGLSAGTYTLKVTGEITNDTIADIKNAMRKSESWINLDLSGTTGLTEIGDEAFFNCLFLISIIIPDNITSIGESAFAFCQHLADFNIPQKVATIEKSTFIGCPNLTNFKVDTNNQYYSSLKNEEILCSKDQKTLIAYPSAKDYVTIPDGITSIGDHAFQACENLTSITIPDSVISIGTYVFSDCSKLNNVTFKDPNGWYYNDDSGNKITIDVTTDTAQNSTKLKENDKYWYKENSVAGTTE